MGPLEIILGISAILVSLLLIVFIIFQKSHRRGVNGAISGAADTFFSKNNSRTDDARLARWTKILAVIFFILAIIFNIINVINKKA